MVTCLELYLYYIFKVFDSPGLGSLDDRTFQLLFTGMHNANNYNLNRTSVSFLSSALPLLSDAQKSRLLHAVIVIINETTPSASVNSLLEAILWNIPQKERIAKLGQALEIQNKNYISLILKYWGVSDKEANRFTKAQVVFRLGRR